MKKGARVLTTGAKIKEVLRESGFPSDRYEKPLKKFLKKIYAQKVEK